MEDEVAVLRQQVSELRAALEPLADIPRKLRIFGRLPVASIKVNVGITLLDRAREVLDRIDERDQS